MINDFNLTDEFPDLVPFDYDDFDMDASDAGEMDDYMGIHFVGYSRNGPSMYVALVIEVKEGSMLEVDETQVNDYAEHELGISLSESAYAQARHIKCYVETPRAEFVPGWSLSFAASRKGRRGTWKYTKANAI